MSGINVFFIIVAAILTGFGTRAGQHLYDWLFPRAKRRITTITNSKGLLQYMFMASTLTVAWVGIIGEIVDPNMTNRAPLLGMLYGIGFLAATVGLIALVYSHRIERREHKH